MRSFIKVSILFGSSRTYLYLCPQIMKQTVTILVVCAAIMMCGACKEKVVPKDTAEYADSFVIPQPGEPVKMTASSQEFLVKWNGESCMLTIKCEPTDSLPMVSNEYGQKYVDNYFDLLVTTTSDHKAVFHRKIGKSMFLTNIADGKVRSEYAQKALLKSVSVELNKANNELRYFVVSLQAPEAVEDEYLLFKYKTNGNIELMEDDIRVNMENGPSPDASDEEMEEG